MGVRHLAIERIFTNPFFARFKPHFCPKCKAQMELVKCSRIVHSKSEEALYFDSKSVESSYIFEDVKFIWDEFKCPKCGFQISIEDMKALEKKRIENF